MPAPRLPSLEAVRAERCRRSLSCFIRYGWHAIEPDTPLIWNWHIDAMCDHIQAMLEDWIHTKSDSTFVQRMRSLLINIPPGTAKSRVVSVYMLAWMWLRHPAFKAIFLSCSEFNVFRDSDHTNDLICSQWYQSWFRPDWQIRRDSDSKSYFRNTAGGWRRAIPFGARITGERGDAVVWDDPHDASDAESDPLRITVIKKWDRAIGNRLNDMKRGLRLGVMQRLHEEDLSGHVLKQKWHHLCLPMEYEIHRPCTCADCQRGESILGWRDPRTKEGELLFPERFPPEILAEELIRLGSYGYAGQMQQRPIPAGGGVFKTWWFRYWQHSGQDLPPVRIERPGGEPLYISPVDFDPDRYGEGWAQSWDFAFKDTAGSDFVAGLVGVRREAETYLIDSINRRMDFTTSCAAVKAWKAQYPKSGAVLIEDKANGPAVINTLRADVPGLIAIEPDGGKVARANAVQPFAEAGNFYLPHPHNAPWVAEWLAQVTSFPNAAHDDMVDAFTQLAARWYTSKRKKKFGYG